MIVVIAIIITLYTIGVVFLWIDSLFATITKCKYNTLFGNIG